MKTIVCALLLLVVSAQPARAACDQTFANTTGLAAGIASAANGSTVCLGDGTYTGVTVLDAARSGYVTIQSTTGTGATLVNWTITNSDFIKITNVGASNMLVNGCSTNIQILTVTFTPSAPGLGFHETGAACSGQANVVDGADFRGVDAFSGDGRIYTEGPLDGLTIRNSLFGKLAASSNSGVADGVQVGGGTHIVIGPGNIFDGLSQSWCDSHGGMHCDAVQLYAGPTGTVTVTQNLFRNGTTYIMAPDGGDGITITYNVFDECAEGYSGPVQFGSNSWPLLNVTFNHNTVRCGNIGGGSAVGTNIIVTNNIFFTNGAMTSTYDAGTCSGTCTRSFNLFNDVTQQIGTNVVSGTPLWMGGATPATWAGWQLTALSPGHNAASDGTDIGTTYYGTATATPAYRLRFR